MAEIVIKQPIEEQLEIFANGILVGSYNEEEHGYDGLEEAERLAAQIGYALNVDVVRI